MGGMFGKINFEMPDHEVVYEGDGYQVWKYPSSAAAIVDATRLDPEGPGKNFQYKAFNVLARYIGVFNDGDNVKANSDAPERVAMTAPVVMTPESGPEKVAMTAPVVMTPAPEPEKVAMTAPVVMTPTPESERIAMTAPVVMTPEGTLPAVTAPESMTFLLPSKYTTVAEAPVPTNPAVRIKLVPERYVAVKRYSGNETASSDGTRKQAQELLSKMKKDQIVPIAPYAFCGYNSPFTLPFLMRNEVHYEVEQDEAKFSE